MSEATFLQIRTTKSLKRNTRQLLRELYDIGARDDRNLSKYVLEAIAEKRQRDQAAIRMKMASRRPELPASVNKV